MLKFRNRREKRDVLGFRLPMLTYEEPELDITDITIIDPDNTYFMRMGGNAMKSYAIQHDHILVIDRSIRPTAGCIVVFYYQGEFYTREYVPERNRLVLRSDEKPIVIPDGENWACWGVVMLTLNPVLPVSLRIGRYARVCTC